MSKASGQLDDLRVADAMSAEVVTLPSSATMNEAADVLNSHGIHGAPVVDDAGHVIGVLTTADFAKLDTSENPCLFPGFHSDEFELKRAKHEEPFHIEHESPDCVRQHMTPAVQTIGAEQSLRDAALCMSASRIHRLIVIDSHSRPVGVLSPIDILAKLAGISNGCPSGSTVCQKSSS